MIEKFITDKRKVWEWLKVNAPNLAKEIKIESDKGDPVGSVIVRLK